MPIWINRIDVENLGPVGDQSFTLDRYNLIYGYNETGKTYLVELTLQSLFRHAAQWSLRELPGRGKVSIQGLENGAATFTPQDHKKLEDYWKEDDQGLPTNMAQLLVVKGGELELSQETPGGVGRTTLKTILSRETLLESILDPIQRTVQQAKVEGGEIIADRRGKVKSRQELKSELAQLKNLLEKVEERYSGGPVRSLEIRLNRVQSDLEKQKRARRYHAYKLQQEMDRLQSERSQLPDAAVEDLRDHLRDYQKSTARLEEKRRQLAEKEHDSQHYSWLQNAVETWERQELDRAGQPGLVFAVAGLTLTILSLLSALLDQTLVALIFILPGFTALIYYLWRLQRWARSTRAAEEKESIQESYQDRFGEKIHGLADLKTQLDSIREDHITAERTREDIRQEQGSKTTLKGEIHAAFQDLAGEKVPEEKWDETLAQLREKTRDLDDEIRQLEREQAALDVKPGMQRTQPAEVKYQPEKLTKLRDESEEIQRELQEKKGELENLKHSICAVTGDEIDTPWNKVLEGLRELYDERIQGYKSLTAEILAKMGVTQVLQEVKEQEDKKIRRGLRSPEVLDILNDVLDDYQSLDFTGDQVLVKGSLADYPLGVLSTGAQEQIQLALRMGFASLLTEGRPLFLILDDAFQHSDWQRRQCLVKKTVELAKNDWQIINLTMDDHLRDLFREAGERIFPDEFTYYELHG